jgi:signal transduction histidine kinase
MTEVEKLKEQLRLLKRRLWAAERLRHDAIMTPKGSSQGLDSHLLAAGVAHEFNNILGAADGHAEWALESGTLEDMREALQVVRQACERSLQITQSLQGLSSPEEEAVAVFSLAKVSQDLLKHFKPLTRKLGVNLEIDLDDLNLYGIEARFFEVLLNLVKNSFEALSQEKAKHADFLPQIRVTSQIMSKRVRIWVEDNGAGVPPALQEKIFQPFFTTKGRLSEMLDSPERQDSQINRQLKGGSGLGLFLSRGIVAQMGGKMKLVPTKKGSRFELLLPLAS